MFTSKFIFALLLIAAPSFAQTTAPNVPKGTVTKYTYSNSKTYPGTTRDYWIYIPAEYDPAKPACLFVDQDGVQFKSPAVFDQLIASHEMPVTIGIYIEPGVVKSAHPDKALDRFNRSYEYDSMGDTYAHFLIDEFLPRVEREHHLSISPDANDHCIAGSSSGAICAFTVAWERPDKFSRVFSAIGTYVGLRGGNEYPTLIRKTEPKPLRIFLQDGSADHNHYGGDWWMANQEMERSLTFAGYEVNHAWGVLGHSGVDGAKVFPDAMRYLWKNYPEKIATGKGSEQLQQILVPSESWQLVTTAKSPLDGLTTSPTGQVFYHDQTTILKLNPDNTTTAFAATHNNDVKDYAPAGQCFDAAGKLYALAPRPNELFTYDDSGKPTLLAGGIYGDEIAVAHNGNIYITEPGDNPTDSKIWLVTPAGEKTTVDTNLKTPSGICLSPDQSLLYVADHDSRWVYSYVIANDGTLNDKQRYYHLHVPDAFDDAGAASMRVDTDGRLYVATRMGVQVCDQAGRVNAIIPVPTNQISSLTFAGPDSNILYITSGRKIYKRTLKTKGFRPFESPIKPAPPHL